MDHKITLHPNSEITFHSKNREYKIIANNQGFTIEGDVKAIFGLGERFNSVNHKGHKYSNKVEEHFCNQGSKTYFPLPFFYTEDEWGMFINTPYVLEFDFTRGISVGFDNSLFPLELTIFTGDPLEIISEFTLQTGKPVCPPDWALGPWISAHRWNSTELVNEQLKALKELEIPATVMVIEQWSDEATFYIFNGAKYHPQNKPFTYGDFKFDKDSPWPDPKKMFDDIHKEGLKVLLWQCPVVKKLEKHEPLNKQHELDEKEVVEHKYIPLNPDGTPYTIPDGHWFPGSMVPDFTNPKATKWWFDKRKYLLDIGVDGFKTDGGEFIYRDDIVFSNEKTGKEMVNQYCAEYVKAYTDACGPNRVIFSRAGYIGQQQYPIQWAGDQESTWSELRSVLNAGLSTCSSGQIFWGFDIGGFSGELPSVELYKRSVQLATFTPIMQVHSEPIGGQFAGMRPTKKFVNDRTPWNMAEYYGDGSINKDVGFYFNLRMNLLPTIYSEALKATQSNQPLMKHCLLVYPDDHRFLSLDDQYFFGAILVAPILNPGQQKRTVYLPKGTWFNLFTNEAFVGDREIEFEVGENDCLAFVPSGAALVLNLNENTGMAQLKNIGVYVGNNASCDGTLTVRCYGEKGNYQYIDSKNDFIISWDNNKFEVQGIQKNELYFEFVGGGNIHGQCKDK